MEVGSEAIVFVTQIPNRKDKATGVWAPAFNIAPAAEFGTIVTIIPANASFFATESLVRQMKEKLREYNFNRGDSIVCSGDPSVIAVAGSILADNPARKYRILKWEKSVSRYISVEINLNI